MIRPRFGRARLVTLSPVVVEAQPGRGVIP